MATKIVDNENNAAPRRFTDEHTDQRIHQHLLDKDDEITHEDIKAVRSDESITGSSLAKDKSVEDQSDYAETSSSIVEIIQEEAENDAANKKIKTNDDPSIDTTWNALQ